MENNINNLNDLNILINAIKLYFNDFKYINIYLTLDSILESFTICIILGDHVKLL